VILFCPSGQVIFLFPRGKMNRDRSVSLRDSPFLNSRSLCSRRYVETYSLPISPDDSVVHSLPSIFSGLCFQKLTKPFFRNPCRFTSIQNHRGVTHRPPEKIQSQSRNEPTLLFVSTCRLLLSLCALFRARILYFQQFTDSFCKTPGVGVGRFSRLPYPTTRYPLRTCPVPLLP